MVDGSRKRRRGLAVGTAGLLLGLCSVGARADGPATGGRDALPAQYREHGVKVAVFNDWPPDEFVEGGVLKGWSVDMAKAMGERLGVPFELTGTSFDAIIPGLVAKRFDAGFSSFGVTPERLNALDFVPQRMEGTAYASPVSKAVTINGEKDLCGHSVAVITGAWDFQYLAKLSQTTCTAAGAKPIDLQQFTTENAAELAVSSGRVEMVAAGSAKLQYLAKETGKFAVSAFVSNPVRNGIGVRGGDPLGPALRNALQGMIEDGSYDRILAKWGVSTGRLTKAVLVTKADPDPR
jgi:polar amino acid transport system substrate-binding protein